MNPFADYHVNQLHQEQLRRDADLHRLATAARRGGGRHRRAAPRFALLTRAARWLRRSVVTERAADHPVRPALRASKTCVPERGPDLRVDTAPRHDRSAA